MLEEIKFHQQAESQLISKHTKTTEPNLTKKPATCVTKQLIDMCKSTGQKTSNKTEYIYIYLIYIYKNAVVNTQTSEAKTPHRKNLKNHKIQTASTVDNEAHSPFFLLKWGKSCRRFRHGPHPSHCGEEAFLTKPMLLSNIASTSSLGTSASSVNKGCFNWREGKSARFETEGILPNQGRT